MGSSLPWRHWRHLVARRRHVDGLEVGRADDMGESFDGCVLIHDGLHLFKGAIAMLARRPNFRQRRIIAFTAASCYAKSTPVWLHCGDLPCRGEASGAGPSCAGRSAKRVFALDDPRIHRKRHPWFKRMDCRVKPGNDRPGRRPQTPRCPGFQPLKRATRPGLA